MDISGVGRFLITETEEDILEPFDFKYTKGHKQMRGVKKFLHLLDVLRIRNLLGYPTSWQRLE
ncbi:hypothetical protein [Methanoculleus sp. UBA413]|jgi:hypothetical protein|uniref:hypothetical protein n=1 Tax=Methanoculleus sp. UBA413 TaxID=1915509 RepID=UPI002579DE5A|nr:hypothetical protein [Methanoculleus sp. UBA413]